MPKVTIKKRRGQEKSYTPLFRPVRTLLFQLPVEERLEILEEVRRHDWKAEFHALRSDVSAELKSTGLKQEDIPALIERVRKKH